MRERLSGGWWILGFLTLINLLNYLDRYILAALVPAIQADLHVHDGAMGLLGTAFMLTYFAISPIFGWLGDRTRRFPLLAFGVGFWSLATMASGMARQYGTLFLARCGVGVGEASYGSISPALLGDLFPPARRGRIFAIFFMAIPVGSALGYLAGGWLEAHVGWRGAFLWAGIPGLLLAIALLFCKEPPRGQYDSVEAKESETPHSFGAWLGALKELSKNSPYVYAVAGYVAYTFVVGGLGFWVPAYFVRVFNVSLANANFLIGGLTVAGGFLGTMAGGWWADRWAKRSADAYMKVSALSLWISVPLLFVVLLVRDLHLFLAILFVAQFFLFLSTSPVNAELVHCVPVSMRATAQAMAIFSIHLFGDAISPSLVGWLSDGSDLPTAMLIFPAVLALGALFWTGKFIFAFEALPWPSRGVKPALVQNHRGVWAKEGIQENTLASFRAAAKAGGEMIELDVQLSYDGEVVVVHDQDIQRISGKEGKIVALTARDLKEMANVPTLRDVLLDPEIPKKVNIELKTDSALNVGLEKAVGKVVRECEAEDRVLFSSFNPLALRRIARELPDVPRALLVTNESDPANRFYLKHMMLAFLARIHLVHLDQAMIDGKLAYSLKVRRVPWAVWTVNDPERAKKFLALGAKSIISDVPGIVAAEVKK